MPAFQGMVSEENLMQLIAYIKTLKPRRRGAGSASSECIYEHARTDTPQLSRRAVRRRGVAPHEGPQAHRDAVPDLDHDLLRGRRPVRRRASGSSC